MRFMEDPAGCDPVASLGFDVLAGVPSAEDLAPMLAKRRVAIKNVLLDQVHGSRTDRLLIGVCNHLVQAIVNLYQQARKPCCPACMALDCIPHIQFVVS